MHKKGDIIYEVGYLWLLALKCWVGTRATKVPNSTDGHRDSMQEFV